MKRIHAFALGLAISSALLATQARAVEPATISFQAPTKYTDGSAIEEGTAISYDVLQALKGATKVKVATITSTSATISTGLVAGSEYCFQVVAVINGQASAPSNEACKLIPLPVPTAVVITVR